MAASTLTVPQREMPMSLDLRGRVGMWSMIVAESVIFTIFVVAYLYYAGKSLTGPTPREVLEVPIFISICLFSSSFTVVHGREGRSIAATSSCSRYGCSPRSYREPFLWLAAYANGTG